MKVKIISRYVAFHQQNLPECVRMCVVTDELWENLRSHIGQRNGFWPEIDKNMKILVNRFDESIRTIEVYFSPQVLFEITYRINSPVCVLTCAVRFAACEKLFLQSGHRYGRSPVNFTVGLNKNSFILIFSTNLNAF